MHRSKLLCQRAHRASTVSLPKSRTAGLHGNSLLLSPPTKIFTSSPNISSYSTSPCKSACIGRNLVIAAGTRPVYSLFIRTFSNSPTSRKTKAPTVVDGSKAVEDKPREREAQEELEQREDQELKEQEREFLRPEKAEAVAQLNLSARLSAEKTTGKWGGFREVWRLLSIVKGETKTLTLAFAFLIVSSTISISIPYTIGKILDQAAKSNGGNELLFGLDQTTFYLGFGTLLVVGASATYGRIITLRVVGERIVTRLRSQLFRQTYSQNAEFFDANRTGDLISRLGSDTIIVGKSITQNLSDGLRSIVSGAAGIGAMAYVSLKLTAVLAIIGPFVAVGSIFYGRIVRNISRKIQENLGTLTKIAEERLGNVKTSQAFAGEILEVARYNKQTKKIFRLGVKEGLYSAAYYGAVGCLCSWLKKLKLTRRRTRWLAI